MVVVTVDEYRIKFIKKLIYIFKGKLNFITVDTLSLR